MLYLHNDIFVTDIIGYNWLKFTEIHNVPPLWKNAIVDTPLQPTSISGGVELH